MRRPAPDSAARPRQRRKPADTPVASRAAGPLRNVGSLEALSSLALGVVMVVAALVPRSFKQFLLLTFGLGLVRRGLTGNCGLYEATGINTADGSLPGPVEKPRASAKD